MIVLIMIGFGALGGLAQGMIASGGVLVFPERKSNGLQLGCLADAFIGGLSGLGSLLIAALLLGSLNDGLFAGQNSEAVKLLGSVPQWALQASLGIFAGFAGRRLLPAVSDRLARAIEDKVKAATQDVGVGLASVSADQLSTVMDQLGAMAMLAPGAATASPGAASLDAITALVNEYDTIEDPSWQERVRLKDDCYRRMSREILSQGITAQQLVAELKKDNKQGWMLALAALVSARPEMGQAALLLDHASVVSWKHVMFRLASAIGILVSQHKISKADADRAQRVFDVFPNPDKTLADKFKSTRALIATRYQALP